ncbi:MAG: ABC transporter substrate-binding protein [Clostridiales Family XIII bacterium]|jgi:ABC-type transport system substrate-binding protein|nr:ABC transporter substrate-binding protein [Clostridiales Family XIII bacterium]
MRRKNFILTVIVMCVVMLATTACGGSGGNSGGGSGDDSGSAPSGDDSAARVLRVGTTESGGGFNPWGATRTMLGNYLVFDTIVRRTPDGKDYDPWCTSYEYTDPTTMVITLRDDVTFSDGDKLSGEDVVFTFERAADPSLSIQANYFDSIDFEKSTVSDDGLTVTFKFKQEYGPFESFLDTPMLVNKSAVEDWSMDDERWWDAPVASGPYEVAENVSGSHTTYKLRDDYWNKDFPIDWDEIIVNYYSDPTAMFVAFENKEIDLVIDVAAQDAARLESGEVANAEEVKYEELPSNSAYLLHMSPDKKEFQDPKVREAVANAIDRTAVGDVAYNTLWQEVDSVLPAGVLYYKSTGTYDKGIEYAKQCMAESGYPDGFDAKVIAMNLDSKVWEVIQSGLSELGINLTTEAYDLNTCLPLWMEQGSTDLMLMNVPGGNVMGEPFVSLSQTSENGGMPGARVMDAEYNELFNASIFTTNHETRTEKTGEVQQWLYDNFQAIPLIEDTHCFAYHTDAISECGFNSAVRADLLYCRAAQ